MTNSRRPTVHDVRNYWESNPLYSFEIADPGSNKFFAEFDRVKRNDVERFAMEYWEFDRYRGRSVLDVGCGPGWLTVQYARSGAVVCAIDLTSTAVDLSSKHLTLHGLSADLRQGSAERIPFDDNRFDLLVSSGVLHHTPDTQQAFRECFRVLKPGGRAKITLYRLGVLHSRLVFPITRLAMKILSVKHPGADLVRDTQSVEDFVRAYDGADNPIGIAKTDKNWAEDLQKIGFRVESSEVHFFPKRFVPMGRYLGSGIHYALDRTLGTMVYFNLAKP